MQMLKGEQLPYYPWQQQQWQLLLNRQQNQTLPHALLLYGANGLGKFTFAKHFAEYLLCQHATEQACRQCPACDLLRGNTHPDLFIIQPEEDKKLIKVEQIRHLIELLQQTPQQGRAQVVIIEPAEAMNLAAANALLKTLEEPLGRVYLFLISHQPALLTATIRSRCQMVAFTTAAQQDRIESWLKSQEPTIPDIKLLLKQAENVPLKALQFAKTDQLLKEKKLVKNFLELMNKNLEPLKLVEKCIHDFSLSQILTRLYYLLKDLLMLKFTAKEEHCFNSDLISNMLPLSEKITYEKLFFLQDKIIETNKNLSRNINLNAQLLLEDLFINLIYI